MYMIRMRLLPLLWLFTASASTATVTLDNAFYNKSKLYFTRQHEVINIYYTMDNTGNLYFIEADVANGKTTYEGLYAATHLENDIYKLVQKVLDEGKDITSDGNTVYFAAKDGIYTFNTKEVRAEKYGTITEDIKCICKVHGADMFYILTEDNELLKVTRNGTRLVEEKSVVNAHEIVMDKSNNLYYYSADKQPWVMSGDVKTKIRGLPENPGFIKFVKPPKRLKREVLVNVDNEVYKIASNGKSVKLNYNIVVRPSAVSIEEGFVVWYSLGRNIYLKPFYVTGDW